jgi:hypothetical protein
VTDKPISEITPEDIETARRRIEDYLINMRDIRVSVEPGPRYGHGLVVKESDGRESGVIRLSTAEAILMALRAITNA